MHKERTHSAESQVQDERIRACEGIKFRRQGTGIVHLLLPSL